VTEPLAPHGRTVECLSCGSPFKPRKYGHVYCSTFCRHRGERKPHECSPASREAVERLFDESRDSNEPVRLDDWHPGPPEWIPLDACKTVGSRRQWYLNLLGESR
jgi:hypothetical protein